MADQQRIEAVGKYIDKYYVPNDYDKKSEDQALRSSFGQITEYREEKKKEPSVWLVQQEAEMDAILESVVFNAPDPALASAEKAEELPDNAMAPDLGLLDELIDQMDETEDLLKSAGYALSRSSKFDIIVVYFLEHQIYDMFEINDVLYAYEQPIFE